MAEPLYEKECKDRKGKPSYHPHERNKRNVYPTHAEKNVLMSVQQERRCMVDDHTNYSYKLKGAATKCKFAVIHDPDDGYS